MFRLKIALLSTIISGIVLIAFGASFLLAVNRAGLDRVDRELSALGESQLHVWHPRSHWEDFGQSIAFIYGDQKARSVFVRVAGGDGQVLYESPNLPQGLSAMDFPGYDRPAGTRPRPRPPSGGRGPGAPEAGPLTGGPRPANGPPPPPMLPKEINPPIFKTLTVGETKWRACAVGNNFVTILLGMDLAEFQKEAARFRQGFFLAVPLALLVLAAGGWVLAHRALRPVARITETAELITARDLSRRIPSPETDDELARLTRVINNMLDRLEISFGQALRFSSDAAHELQTPLAVVQGMLDEAVSRAADGSEEQQRYGSLLEEVRRLKGIVRRLLLLARADAGRLQPVMAPVDFSSLVEAAAEDAAILAPLLQIEQRITPDLTVSADPDLLQQAIRNLISNAVKYNTEGGRIRLALTVEQNEARLAVASTGPAISGQDRKRIFDRFYRADPSRTGRTAGTGLGLNLALEIVLAHNGRLLLDPRGNDMNSFSLFLPLYSA